LCNSDPVAAFLALSPLLFLPSVLLAIILFASWRPEYVASETVAEPFPVAISDYRIAFGFDDAPHSARAFLEPDERPRLLIEALKTAGIEQAVFFISPGRITADDNDAADIAAYA
jgi:hypothetical protein